MSFYHQDKLKWHHLKTVKKHQNMFGSYWICLPKRSTSSTPTRLRTASTTSVLKITFPSTMTCDIASAAIHYIIILIYHIYIYIYYHLFSLSASFSSAKVNSKTWKENSENSSAKVALDLAQCFHPVPTWQKGSDPLEPGNQSASRRLRAEEIVTRRVSWGNTLLPWHIISIWCIQYTIYSG